MRAPTFVIGLLLLLAGCGTTAAPAVASNEAAATASTAPLDQGAADDADHLTCTSTVVRWSQFLDTYFPEPANQIFEFLPGEFKAFSSAMQTFGDETRADAETFTDTGLRQAWHKAAASAEAQAIVLADGDVATALTALTEVLGAVNAATTACTDFTGNL